MYLLALFFLINLGCAVYDEGLDLSSVNECEQSGGLCEEPTGSALLSLAFANSDRYSIKNPTNRRFDLNGYCNEADFPQNVIEYTVFRPSDNSIIIPITRAQNLCKRGKFRLQVDLPLNDPMGNPVNVQQISRVRLELVGLDLNNIEYRNTLAAQHTVDIVSIP
jgi:hypothetical protein